MASGSTSHSCPFTGSAPYKSSHVASDPSAFLQGSVQQLIIHPDPRTPEEMCEAEESSVSPPPLLPVTPTVGPEAPAAREGPGTQAVFHPKRHGVSEIPYPGKRCIRSYFELFGFVIIFENFSHVFGVR